MTCQILESYFFSLEKKTMVNYCCKNANLLKCDSILSMPKVTSSRLMTFSNSSRRTTFESSPLWIATSLSSKGLLPISIESWKVEEIWNDVETILFVYYLGWTESKHNVSKNLQNLLNLEIRLKCYFKKNVL